MADQATTSALPAPAGDSNRSSQGDIAAGRWGSEDLKRRRQHSSSSSISIKKRRAEPFSIKVESKHKNTKNKRQSRRQSKQLPKAKESGLNTVACVAQRTRSKTYTDTDNLSTSVQKASSTHSSLSGPSYQAFQEQDFVPSPFNSSTYTDLIESDHSVYSPTKSRRRIKKRKRVSLKVLPKLKVEKKFLFLKNLEKERESETDPARKPSTSWLWGSFSSDRSLIPHLIPYNLRSRNSNSPSTSRNPAASTSQQNSSASTSNKEPQKSEDSPRVSTSLEATGTGLPYLRPTNARRSIAAANLGSCFTRTGAGQRQRRDPLAKTQEKGGEGASSADMPQPRRYQKGKNSVGSCASSGGGRRENQPPLSSGAVASTSSTPAVGSSVVVEGGTNPAAAAASTTTKSKGKAWTEEESSSEEGEMGRLQALLEARGLPPHLLGALGPRVHHLLHRTCSLSTASTKAVSLLTGLQAVGDESQQLQAVIEMCQLLVMGNEDTLAGFPIRQVVPALVNLLSADHNFDLMNHACRALTYMMEALPRSSGAIVIAIPAFLDKLQAISCMDVAEQSLTALDMLSRRHTQPILQAQGISACLTYLDFFSINAQRAALSITANCCQNLTPDDFFYIKDSLPLLTSRLTHEDKKSVEYVCLAFSRIVDSYQKHPQILVQIASNDLLTNLLQLLVVSPAGLSSSTFVMVVRLLWSLCGASGSIAANLQGLRATEILLQLLTNAERAPHELYELTGLLAELLPKLPTYADHEQMSIEGLDPAVTAEAIDATTDERIAFVRSETWRESGTALLLALQDVYSASAGPGVRAQCVRAMLRLIYYADSVALAHMVNMQVMSALLASMLGGGDTRLAAGALQLADVLMTRLPDVAPQHFRREGVIHQVLQLAQQQANPSGSMSLQASPQQDHIVSPLSHSAPPEENVSSSFPETSSRSSNVLQLADVLKRKRATKRNSFSSVSKHLPSEFRPLKTSFLSSLHPTRWARARVSEPETQHNRRAVREWVRSRASRLARSWGVMSVGKDEDEPCGLSRLEPGLSSDPRRALVALRDTLCNHHVSPFQVNHSGMIEVLFQFLTTTDSDHLRIFLNVFVGLPTSPEWNGDMESVQEKDTEPFGALVSAVLAALAQREQLPVRVHEMRSDMSALKFFNTHQLTCDLKRHPDCNDLKQWKGGVVRIDPLAVVNAIEKYLAGRGYARTRDASSDDASDDEVETTAVLNPSEHKLEFLIGDTVLPYNMTVYQAVRQYGDHSDTDTDTEAPLGSGGIWAHTHTIFYRAAPTPPPAYASRKGKGHSAKSRRSTDTLWNEGRVIPAESALSGALREAASWSTSPAATSLGTCAPALALCRALHAISRYWHSLYNEPKPLDPLLSADKFVSTKLTAKANRHIYEPLVILTGNIPSWLPQIGLSCPFVFPFECRQLLFYVVSFDRERALQRLMEYGGVSGVAGSVSGGNTTNDSERPTPRLERRRRAVTRHHLLRQAEKLLSDLETRPLLEVQYEGEVGTGLGPTLEFYALVSLELQRADLDMWYGSDNFKRSPTLGRDAVKSPPPGTDNTLRPIEGGEVVTATCGLYAAPLGRNVRSSLLSRVKAKFRFLGKFMAKAVMDSRMVDLPLSPAFYRWLVGEDRHLDLSDVRHVSPELWRSLVRLRHVAEKARAIESDASMAAEQKNRELEALELDGCPIEELGLAMMLPGARDVELRRGGRDMTVTSQNLSDYVSLVTHWTLNEGVQRQMDAFKEGFESVFPLQNIKMFYPEELEMIFCGCASGNDSKWDIRILADCIRADHGYSGDSRSIKMLLEILSTYEKEERRLFLQFVTGSPRLPTGGLKSLNPPLTVVRKTVEGPTDAYLPSVMTCVNYLKLPEYSGAEVMRARLRLAALEGQHSFHLS